MSTRPRYDSARQEMLEYVPNAGSILDVGCATGRFGQQLRAAHPEAKLWGIDPDPHPEDHPMAYGTRITGWFPADVPEGQRFDCVVFNDVLEHMVDPWSALRTTRRLLAEDGHVVASIPNVRHLRVVKPLVLGGRFDYRDTGILDRTHLRFFTRATIRDLFESCGYEILTLEPVRVSKMGKLARLNRFTGGRFTDFLTEQYAVVACPRVVPHAE